MQNQTPLTVPAAIIVAGIIIAGGIIVSRYVPAAIPVPTQNAQSITVNLPAVSATDHIIGQTNADIVLVEYSDTECPFCKVFHGTMHTLISQYGPKNQLAWVYRHLPLYKPDAQGRSLHSKAGKEAEATECAFDQGGNDVFWKYLDLVYQTTTSNNTLDPAQLPAIAKKAGLNVVTFNTCLSSGKYTDAIAKSYDEGFVAGAQGTPYNVLMLKKSLSPDARQQVLNKVIAAVAKNAPGSSVPPDLINFSTDGTKITFSGALPADLMKTLLDAVLK